MSFIANAQRTKKDKLLSPAECNPYLVEEVRRNRPKTSDVKFLGRMLGARFVNVPGEPDGQ